MAAYTHVVIIGNGFDLNLGLKTHYNDFIRSREFNTLLENRNKLALHLQQQHHLQGWVDIENELKIYANGGADDNFRKEFNNLCIALIDYMSQIDANYAVACEAMNLIQNIAKENFKVFNYNYTQSVETLLRNENVPEPTIAERVTHMHGSIMERKIIFGVEDAAQIPASHIFLKKAYSQLYKGNNLFNCMESALFIHFFGHSLGPTDHQYFKEFFQNMSHGGYRMEVPKELIFYFHDQSGYDSLMQQLDVLTLQQLGRFRDCCNFRPLPV